MKAVLLSAGMGTRLRPITDRIPKIMAPVAYGVPLLGWQIVYLASQGITEIAINTYHLSEHIHEYIDAGDWKILVDDPPDIFLYSEHEPYGTAGALVQMTDFFIQGEPFYVLYGDTVTNVDLNQMQIEYMLRDAPMGVIAVYEGETAGKGNLDVIETEIVNFNEKASSRTEGIVNAGVYYLNPDIVGWIREGDDFGYHVFPKLIEDGEALAAYFLGEHEHVIDIGTPEGLNQAEHMIRTKSL